MDHKALIGKYVVAYTTAGDMDCPERVTVTGVTEILGQHYLVGKQSESHSGMENWLREAESYIAMSQIASFHVFESEAAYVEAIDRIPDEIDDWDFLDDTDDDDEESGSDETPKPIG